MLGIDIFAGGQVRPNPEKMRKLLLGPLHFASFGNKTNVIWRSYWKMGVVLAFEETSFQRTLQSLQRKAECQILISPLCGGSRKVKFIDRLSGIDKGKYDLTNR